jgi:hypothetical protein
MPVWEYGRSIENKDHAVFGLRFGDEVPRRYVIFRATLNGDQKKITSSGD